MAHRPYLCHQPFNKQNVKLKVKQHFCFLFFAYRSITMVRVLFLMLQQFKIKHGNLKPNQQI